jgi:hypothetical protein
MMITTIIITSSLGGDVDDGGAVAVGVAVAFASDSAVASASD